MVASDPQLSPGTIVLGEVRVESVVCVSGPGALYLGRSTTDDASVLIRAMESASLDRAGDVFAREVLVVRHLEHDGIVAPVLAGVENGQAAVAYEAVNGPVLNTQLGKSMPLSEVSRIATELAAILNHAHRQPAPLVHGALSTSSIVLAGAARSVRLLDLGIVQALGRANVFDEALWDILDPAAAAPEQVSRAFPTAAATDVFGLASIAYECLTGRPAFPAKNAADAEAMIVSGKRPSAREVRHELNPDVDRLLEKAWSVDPRSRPHDIVAFASSLAAALVRPAGALSEPIDTKLEFDEDDEAETVNLPGKALKEVIEEVRARNAAPKAKRAHTLPFGLPTPAPVSEPPPPPQRPAEPAPVVTKEATPAPAPAPAPAPRPAQAPPPMIEAAPPIDPDVRTVRVVSVTGLFVSLVLAGAVIIAGAFVAAGSLLVQRAAPPAPTPIAPLATSTASAAPTPTPTPTPTPEPPPPPPPSASASAQVAEPVVAVMANTTSWPELPKEAGPRPTAKALETMRLKLKTAFEPCLKIPPKAPQGIPWMVHFEIDGPSGQPVLIEVSRPFKGTLAGACMMRAALDARLPPFDSARWAIDLRFGP